MRERLATRLGFILLSAGCAIGLGNVWRFPYVTGQCGGGWFVLLYLFFLAIIGVPVLTMEFAAGRAAQRSIATLPAALTPGKRGWRVLGAMGLVGNVVLMMFYTTVTGWMLLYFLKTAGGGFAGLGPAEIDEAFSGLLGGPVRQAAAMAVVCLSAAAVCAFDLQKGLERITKRMMLCLLALIVVLAANSLLLDGAAAGIRFYLVPDFARMRSVGVVKVVVEAMNHAFFTLSLGIGAMAIFGSYIDRRRRLLGEALCVASLDTCVAVMAGFIIIPACFAYGVEPGQGPGLVFVTLPNVFNHMPAGRFWGTLFFAFMSCAAMTTVLAVFETVIACVRDLTGWGRVRTSVTLGAVLPLLSLPCVLGFNVWSGFRPFGPGSSVLDLEDFVVSNLLLPVGGVLFALYCCHRFGWGWDGFRKEANTGVGPRFAEGPLRVYCAFVLPVVIFAVFVVGLLAKFGAVSL